MAGSLELYEFTIEQKAGEGIRGDFARMFAELRRSGWVIERSSGTCHLTGDEFQATTATKAFPSKHEAKAELEATRSKVGT